ncbi:hypothetical protein BDV11DRAFT_195356 [Aspergillus similis]
MARSVALSCEGPSTGSAALVVIGSPTTDGKPFAGASSPVSSPIFSATCSSACSGISLASSTGFSNAVCSIAGVITSVCSTSGSGISGVCLSSWTGTSINFFSATDS